MVHKCVENASSLMSKWVDGRAFGGDEEDSESYARYVDLAS